MTSLLPGWTSSRGRAFPRRKWLWGPSWVLAGELFPRDLADLLEVVALHDVEHDHRGRVVALRVPPDRPGIGDALEPRRSEGSHDLVPRRHGALRRGRGLDGEEDEPRGVVRVHRVVRDRTVLRLVS